MDRCRNALQHPTNRKKKITMVGNKRAKYGNPITGPKTKAPHPKNKVGNSIARTTDLITANLPKGHPEIKKFSFDARHGSSSRHARSKSPIKTSIPSRQKTCAELRAPIRIASLDQFKRNLSKGWNERGKPDHRRLNALHSWDKCGTATPDADDNAVNKQEDGIGQEGQTQNFHGALTFAFGFAFAFRKNLCMGRLEVAGTPPQLGSAFIEPPGRLNKFGEEPANKQRGNPRPG